MALFVSGTGRCHCAMDLSRLQILFEGLVSSSSQPVYDGSQ